MGLGVRNQVSCSATPAGRSTCLLSAFYEKIGH